MQIFADQGRFINYLTGNAVAGAATREHVADQASPSNTENSTSGVIGNPDEPKRSINGGSTALKPSTRPAPDGVGIIGRKTPCQSVRTSY